jgi:hypothetical protein
MKRIYIAIAFLILALTTGIFEMFYVTNKIDELNEEIISADNLVKSENYDGAKSVLASAETEWQKNLSIFDILLIHDYVDEISVNLSAMRSYVATQSNDNYLAESAGIKKQLTSIKDSELVQIENIL